MTMNFNNTQFYSLYFLYTEQSEKNRGNYDFDAEANVVDYRYK